MELRNQIIDVMFEVQFKFEIAVTTLLKNRTRWQELARTDLFMNIKEDGVVI